MAKEWVRKFCCSACGGVHAVEHADRKRLKSMQKKVERDCAKGVHQKDESRRVWWQ